MKVDAPAPGCVGETAYRDLPPSAMEVALERGYYERIGARI